MILDRLLASQSYSATHPGLRAAFDYLRETDLAFLPDGKHEILGERLFAIVATCAGRGREAARLEAHRKYIDVQVAVRGTEEIGWKPTSECHDIREPFDAARDIVFFGERPESWLLLPPGTFAVLFPDDAHAPLAHAGEVLKVVLKVAVDW